jgi:hypothetical protein
MPPGFRQDNDGHVRKKAVTIGLHQRPPPVAKLNFESQQFGINAFDEIVRRDTGTRSRQTIGIPTDRDKVSYPVPVCWNFSRNSKRCFPCAKKALRRRSDDGLAEPVSESAFTTPSCRMLRQISERVVKSQFGNLQAGGRCHVRQITRFDGIASFTSRSAKSLVNTECATVQHLLIPYAGGSTTNFWRQRRPRSGINHGFEIRCYTL